MFWYSKNGQESFFFFYVFFNPKLKQTKVRRVELNRLNDKKKKRHTSVLPLQKSVKRDNKKKQKNIVTNIQWTFLQWDIYRCHVTGNVDVILQSEVDQIDKKLTQSFPIIPSELGSVLLRKQNTEEEPTITLCINVMTACWWYVRFCSGTRSSS